MNTEELLHREITMDDINYAIKNSYSKTASCIFNDYNDDNLIFRLRIDSILSKKKSITNPLDQSDEIYLLKNFQEQLLDNLVIRGIKKISRAIPRKIPDSLVLQEDSYVKKETWVVDTVGTNLLDLLSLDTIDTTRTYTNDIQEIYKVLGIEAARQAIFNEISEVIEFDSTYINYHHLCLLCDRMTCNKTMTSVFRHGINNDNIGPIAKASFEETPEMFLKAARHGEIDHMKGVSSNVMCGQDGYFGTSAFQVILDINKISSINSDDVVYNDINNDIEDAFSMYTKDTDECAINNLLINHTNINNISTQELGDIDMDYDPGF